MRAIQWLCSPENHSGSKRTLGARGWLVCRPPECKILKLPPEKSETCWLAEKITAVFTKHETYTAGCARSKEERSKNRAAAFAPAGQSTQMIIGATDENDKQILQTSASLYAQPSMKRVYYSGFIPVNTYDNRLPALKQPPLVRENRHIEADWLLRFYNFKVDEIVNDKYPDLDLEIDPKLSWALRNQLPVDHKILPITMLLRVPGIGVKSAKLIVVSRGRYARLRSSDLKKIGVVMKKAQYFITCNELSVANVSSTSLGSIITRKSSEEQENRQQLTFCFSRLITNCFLTCTA